MISPHTVETMELLCTHPISVLAAWHERENARFRQHHIRDDRPGLALFRIALGQRRDAPARAEEAWSFLYSCYFPLVLNWITQRANTELIKQESGEALVNAAFAKFSVALRDPHKIECFGSLSEVLGYLKHCVWSVLTDCSRRRAHAESLEISFEETRAAEEEPADQQFEERICADLSARDLQQLIQRTLIDQQERLVFALLFVEEWKPRDIQHCFANHFPTVDDVYRVKRNIVDRLRRNRELRAYRLQASMA